MNISVIGGGGRVGLPLSIFLSSLGHIVKIIEKDKNKIRQINDRQMPFNEPGFDIELRELALTQLEATSDLTQILNTEICIIIVGTPVENGNSDTESLTELIKELMPFLGNTELLMLRSTVSPGMTRTLKNFLKDNNLEIEISYCPERIVEGNALNELKLLPQIIGVDSTSAFKKSCQVFKGISPSFVKTSFEEAEMIKLFANTYRYISFAIANEFFEICQKSNLDWSKIWFALKSNYPRAANLPNPGFASGPCLIKDTQHLNFFYNNNFKLGLAALDINQGLPLFCVKFLENNFNLSKKTVGILGMTFKSEVDDFRSSHSFDLKYLLEARGVRVLCSDEVLQHNYFVSSQILLAQSDIVIIATPHEAYKSLIIEKPLIDIWHCTKNVSLL